MGILDSKEIEWFVNTLQDQFGIIVNQSSIGYERIELQKDEVEDFFVPRELFEEVPTFLLYETMVFDDEQDNVWVGAVAYYPNSPDWCLQVITKNDEKVFRKVITPTN